MNCNLLFPILPVNINTNYINMLKVNLEGRNIREQLRLIKQSERVKYRGAEKQKCLVAGYVGLRL